jgi:tRNA A37 methylthiotransferase MiaB
MGCMAQRLGGEMFRRVPGLDFAAWHAPRRRIPRLVARVLAGEVRLLECSAGRDADVIDRTRRRVLAFVSVLLGCNRRWDASCRRARARVQTPPREILAEVAAIAPRRSARGTLLGRA